MSVWDFLKENFQWPVQLVTYFRQTSSLTNILLLAYTPRPWLGTIVHTLFQKTDRFPGAFLGAIHLKEMMCNFLDSLWNFLLSPVYIRKSASLKGTVPPDFSPLIFFFKQLLLAPVDKPSNDFDFFWIFADIFDFSGASPVLLTPAKQTIFL